MTYLNTKTFFCGILFVAVTTIAPAAEVYFDTVSTEKSVRAQGAYFGFFGGGSWDYNVDSSGTAGLSSEQDGTGWFIGAELGYQFRTAYPVRPAFEVELFYAADKAISENATSRLSNDFYSVNLMVNFILALDLSDYRDDVGFLASLHPYIGGGLGGAYTNADSSLLSGSGDGLSLGSSGKISFAYQFLAGLEVDLSDYVSIYGEYRRLWINNVAGSNFSESDRNLWNIGFKVQY